MVLATTCLLSNMLVNPHDDVDDIADLEWLAAEDIDTPQLTLIVDLEQVRELAGEVDLRHQDDPLALHEWSDLVVRQRQDLARRQRVHLDTLLGQTVDRLDHGTPGRTPGDNAN